ncbi:hypothetical protein RhiJN_16084 [Ceratobasidium sp. AG-Ba]|nr:hypothetical protein RhiJN_16084 [Ceratobasidium sp. AG-Ba]
MSVKVIDHIYYGYDNIPKAQSPTTSTADSQTNQPTTKTRPREASSSRSLGPAGWLSGYARLDGQLPESPKTRRECQPVLLPKDEEPDPTREPPAHTLTWFVAEALRRSRNK